MARADDGDRTPRCSACRSHEDPHHPFVENDLAESLRVVSYDRRGHGGSEDSAEPGSRRDDEDDLAALIEVLGLAPAHLVGNSFGSSIVLGLAARRPELVRSVNAHEPPLLSLAADDPVVLEVAEGVDAVLTLIERGEAESGARLFVEMVVGPGGWDLMSPEERRTMVANAGTFLGEQRDPDFGPSTSTDWPCSRAPSC